MELTDIRLLAKDFSGCLKFYRDVLGLEVELEVPEGVYAELGAGGVRVSIYKHELMERIVPGLGKPSSVGRQDALLLNMRVSSVDVCHQQLTSRGVKFETQPHDQEVWGIRVAHLRDPEGNLIEIYAPMKATS
jgi:catechol 2,3-dioxygenase-like lactoylglutathione lyase family enzyme